MKKKTVISMPRAIAGSIISAVGVVVVSLGLGGFLVSASISYGPSEELKKDFVVTLSKTDNFKFVPQIFFTDEEIDRIIKNADSNEIKPRELPPQKNNLKGDE